MQEFLTTLIKDEISVPLALCIAVAIIATKWVGGRWKTALKEPGGDRDELINTLKLGGDLRLHYVRLVSAALNRVDRFLGDADKAAQSIPSPFGNRYPARYWTGFSFDVCALTHLIHRLFPEARASHKSCNTHVGGRAFSRLAGPRFRPYLSGVGG